MSKISNEDLIGQMEWEGSLSSLFAHGLNIENVEDPATKEILKRAYEAWEEFDDLTTSLLEHLEYENYF